MSAAAPKTLKFAPPPVAPPGWLPLEKIAYPNRMQRRRDCEKIPGEQRVCVNGRHFIHPGAILESKRVTALMASRGAVTDRPETAELSPAQLHEFWSMLDDFARFRFATTRRLLHLFEERKTHFRGPRARRRFRSKNAFADCWTQCSAIEFDPRRRGRGAARAAMARLPRASRRGRLAIYVLVCREEALPT